MMQSAVCWPIIPAVPVSSGLPVTVLRMAGRSLLSRISSTALSSRSPTERARPRIGSFTKVYYEFPLSSQATSAATLDSIIRADHGGNGAARLLLQTCDGEGHRWMIYADLVTP